MKNRSKSRKQTPWDNNSEPTATQRFIQMQHRNHYEQRHPKLRETGEAEMINSYEPTVCPYCGSESFIMKGLADSENPLDPVNRIHCLLKMFLNAHSGFSRDDLQNYLNLYAFVINPPTDHLEKVEKIIEMVFENPKSLRYRDQFG